MIQRAFREFYNNNNKSVSLYLMKIYDFLQISFDNIVTDRNSKIGISDNLHLIFPPIKIPFNLAPRKIFALRVFLIRNLLFYLYLFKRNHHLITFITVCITIFFHHVKMGKKYILAHGECRNIKFQRELNAFFVKFFF